MLQVSAAGWKNLSPRPEGSKEILEITKIIFLYFIDDRATQNVCLMIIKTWNNSDWSILLWIFWHNLFVHELVIFGPKIIEALEHIWNHWKENSYENKFQNIFYYLSHVLQEHICWNFIICICSETVLQIIKIESQTDQSPDSLSSNTTEGF